MGLFQVLRDTITVRVNGVKQEMIGAGQRIRRTFTTVVSALQRRDVGTPDYSFWDRAPNGKARGIELSGLLLKPIESKIASWVLGSAPTFSLDNETAQQDLTRWWRRQHPRILQAYQRAERLGDNYIVINADLSLTAIPPNCVTPIVEEGDYSKVIGWRIEQKFPHPTKIGHEMTIIDEYTPQQRKRTTILDGRENPRVFRNVIGRVPVVHMACNRGPDELFGRPVGEPLLALLLEYNDVIRAGLDGNKRQGRPTPVIEKLGTPDQVERFFASITKSETDSEGVVTQHVEFDADQLMGLPGDATFKWASPSQFAGDTEKLLGLLFYLYLQSSEIPEFVLGNAIASSKASADAQLPIFTQFIEKKRGEAEEWIREIAEIVLAYIGAVDLTARRAEDDDLEIEWDDLTTEDGELTIKAVETAYDKGWITRQTALSRMPALKIKDPAAELEEADKEQEELKARADEQMESAVERAIRQAEERAAAQDTDTEDEAQPEGELEGAAA